MNERIIPRTVIRCKELEAKLVSTNKTHEIYLCPFCYDKEVKYQIPNPKPDLSGKLYVEISKNRGYCFRCNTVVFTNWSVENSFDCIIDFLQSEYTEVVDPSSLPDISLDLFPLACTIPEALTYLKNRNPAFNEANVKRLQLRWFDRWTPVQEGITKEWIKIRRYGIIAPLFHNGHLKSYQIRYITDDKKRRFHTMDGLRLIATLNQIPQGTEITVCEGYYDVVALFIMGFPNPIGLLGSSPSSFQLHQIRSLVPSKVNLCLDSVELNSALAKTLRKNIKSLTYQKVWKFDEKDPEEQYVKHPEFKYKYWRL